MCSFFYAGVWALMNNSGLLVRLNSNITWKPITCLCCGREAPAASEASHASEASEGERSEPSAHRHIRRAKNRHIRRAKNRHKTCKK